MERKKFIERLFIGTGSVLLVSPVLYSCEKDDDGGPTRPPGGGNPGPNQIIVDLDDNANSNLLIDGGFIYTSAIIVANAGDEEFLALASTCTHEGCTVAFSLPQKKFPCPCHGSEFSSTGSVLMGPATIPLRKYNVAKAENKLIIT